MEDSILSIVGILVLIISFYGIVQLMTSSDKKPTTHYNLSKSSSLSDEVERLKKPTSVKEDSSIYSETDKFHYSFRVAGVSYENEGNISRQKIIKSLHKHSKIYLQSEHMNEHDSMAIAVISEFGKIGYVPKDACKELNQFELKQVSLQIISIGKSTRSAHFGISIKAVIKPPYLNQLTHLQVKQTELINPPRLESRHLDYAIAFECELDPNKPKLNFHVPKGTLRIVPGDQYTICDVNGEDLTEIMTIPAFLSVNSDYRLFLYRVINICIFKIPVSGNYVRVIFKIKNPYLDKTFEQKFTLLETDNKAAVDPMLCQGIHDSYRRARFKEVTYFYKNGDYWRINESETVRKGIAKTNHFPFPDELRWVVLPVDEWHNRSEEIRSNLRLNADLLANGAIVSALERLPLMKSRDYIETTKSSQHSNHYDDTYDEHYDPAEHEDFGSLFEGDRHSDYSEADYSVDYGYKEDSDYSE